jgi:CSLREA domain-containing protein
VQASLITGAALAGSAVFAAGAQAGPIDGDYAVNTLADHLPDGCAPDPGDCTLREAILFENEYAGDNAVVFESGLSGAIHLYSVLGDIAIENESLLIDGPGEPGNEVITVNADYDSRIFKLFGFDGPGEEVEISGLTLRHGLVEGSGGAIANSAIPTPVRGGGPPPYYAASLTISDSVITDNVANEFYIEGFGDYGGYGGAIYNSEESLDTLTITNSVITDNVADSHGGAIRSEGTVDIDGSRINDNTSLYGYGGAVAAGFFGDIDRADVRGGGFYDSVSITGSTLNRNASGSPAEDLGGPVGGGALFLNYFGGNVLIEETTIADNETFYSGPEFGIGAPGGGITFGYTGGGLTIRESTISGNQGGREGGGLWLRGPQQDVLVENSTFSNNAALYEGGGIHLYNSSNALVTIQNSTITDNELHLYQDDGDAESEGGGIWRRAYAGPIRGLPGADSVYLSSTIVAENYADVGPDLFDEGEDGAFYADFSLIGIYDSGAAEVVDVESNLIGDLEDPFDPQLLPLGDNAGPTETHLPGATSPALDAGTSNGLTNDQRLLDRVFDDLALANADDGTDIGAVEVQGEEPVPPEEPPPGGVGGVVFEQCLGEEKALTAGTPGNDDLVGTFGGDVIRAFAGDDRLRAIEGRDCLFGDDGNDLAKGGGAVDLVEGGAGTDRLKGQGGADTLVGGDDADNVNGDDGKDTISGDEGSDKLGGNQGNDRITGGSGNDRIRLGVGKDRVRAGSGSDRVGAVDALKDKINCGGGDDRAIVDPIDRVSASCEEVVVVQAEN